MAANEQYINFITKRMYIFSELVKRHWAGKLNTVENLEELTSHIKNKYNFDEKDLPFIKDHIRVAMGLDPKNGEAYTDELDFIKKSEKVKMPVVTKIDGPCEFCDIKSDCECSTTEMDEAYDTVKYEDPMYRRTKKVVIENGECLSCGKCVTECDYGALADKIEFLPVINLLKDKDTQVFAVVAPAIVGQFGENVSMGQMRTAFKSMGFEDMVEVALFADILTIKEAYEFNSMVKNEEDYFLTSCCCPVWFNMVKKSYDDIGKYMSPSVSPMIASGRILKRLYGDDTKVVFISPCIAKKAEIKEPDLVGAIDYALDFRELKEIFEALQIDLESLPADDKDQASLGGRIYARTGGVSFSIKTIVNRLQPRRVIKLKAKKVSGVKECRQLLQQLRSGKEIEVNFFEGMGCVGGCVGGPKTNINKDIARHFVNEYGEDSFILTPFDNQNIERINKEFGIESITDMMDNDELIALLSREI